MKRILSILTFFLITSFAYNAHAALGEKTESGGLKCGSIIHTVGDKEINTDVVKLNEILKIIFNDVEGFTVVNNLVYPGLSIEVVSPEGEKVLSSKNAFEKFSEKGINKIFASKFTATIGTGDPMEEGKTYKVTLRLFDAKGKGQIEYKTDIKLEGVNVQEALPSGEITSSGLTVERAILAKDNKELAYDSFEVGDTVQVFLLNVAGLEKGEDGFYHFDMDVKVRDTSGNIVFEQKELLKEAGRLKLQTGRIKSPMVSIGTKGFPAGKYSATVTIYDKNSSKSAKAKRTFGLFKVR